VWRAVACALFLVCVGCAGQQPRPAQDPDIILAPSDAYFAKPGSATPDKP
jgi:hypothetical protein